MLCGFTSHIDYIYKNLDNLTDIPIWAFHGVIEEAVPVEETDRMIEKLKGKNENHEKKNDNISCNCPEWHTNNWGIKLW